ncbi:MAG: ATP-dependent helicase [Candidatus Dojkabacteria bacterium]
MPQVRLNEKQKEAVEYSNGDLLIIAGAGTGKTAVLTQRILHIIKKELAKPSNILALTFTEKAAQEMQERIDLEMEYGYDEPWISTFHSFCDRILKEDGYNIGLDGNYSLMSPAQAYIFLRRHLYDLPLETLRPRGNPTKFLNDFLKHISRLQDEDVSPEEYVRYAEVLPKNGVVEKEEYIRINELAQTYKKYTELKISNSKIDFGDLIILTIKLFREKPNVLDRYRKQFKYVLVDEFQDTNFTQNVLINILTLGNTKNEEKERPYLTVVGDDDQAIYKFRGAAISNILQFKETYPKAKEVVLTENYRSRQEILDAAYTLIKHNNPNRLENTEKIDKRLVASGVFDEDEDSVNLVVASSENGEAERVCDEILKLTGYSELVNSEGSLSQVFDEKGQSSFVGDGNIKGKYKFSDIAILVRANAHAESFIQELRHRGVPYKLGGSRGLYFRSEVQNLIAFLRVLIDYSDEISMYRLISMPIWGLTPREYIELNMLAREGKTSMLEQLEKLWGIKLGSDDLKDEDFKEVENNLLQKILSAEAIAGLSTLLMILDSSIKKIKDNREIVEVLYDFLMQSLYLNSFLEKEDSESLFAISNINKYFELVKKYQKDNPESNIYEYVDYLNYSIEVGESPLVDSVDMDELNAVNIMTVHGSKGLEFSAVFLVNLVSQRFPAVGRSDSIPIPEALIKETMPFETGEKELSMQEERRLFYVGATRAKEKLYLTAANFYGDAKRKKKPSVFLNEILDRDIEEEFKHLDMDSITDLSLSFVPKDNYISIIPRDEKIDLVKKFSYSQLNVYETCPRKYEYLYVLKIPQKPNSAMSFGTSVHNTLKDFYSLLKQSREGLEGIVSIPTEKELLEIYERDWVASGYESKEQEEARKKEGREIMGNYYKKLFNPKEIPLRLEESFNVHLGETVFNGKIDRIDLIGEKDGISEVCIVDYKTGREKDEADIKKDLQLPLYALFAEEKLGFKVVGAKYVFIEVGKIVEVDVKEKKRELAKEKLLEVIDCVKKKKFNPTPGFVCKYCDYNSVCEYADL